MEMKDRSTLFSPRALAAQDRALWQTSRSLICPWQINLEKNQQMDYGRFKYYRTCSLTILTGFIQRPMQYHIVSLKFYVGPHETFT